MDKDKKAILQEVQRGNAEHKALLSRILGALETRAESSGTPVQLSVPPELLKAIQFDKPKKGVNYFTKEDIEEFKAVLLPLCTPKKGKDYLTKKDVEEFLASVRPRKGIDYVDGVDGKPGKNGKNGKPGRPGKDGKTLTDKELTSKILAVTKDARSDKEKAKEIVRLLETLIPKMGERGKDERLSAAAIKGLRQVIGGAVVATGGSDAILAGNQNSAYNGDGSDGDVTISVNTTLGRSMFYRNLTIDSGAILDPAGYYIFWTGTLTIGAGCKIARNGGNGSNGSNTTGGAAGAAIAAGSSVELGAASSNSGAGANGAATNGGAAAGVSVTSYGGGATTAGGGGGDSASGTGGSGGGIAGSQVLRQRRSLLGLVNTGAAAMTGGISGRGGGGGAGNGAQAGGGGGGGGSGGGVIGLFGNILINNGAIEAIGGNGGNGANSPAVNGAGGGGGAGAGGGVIYLVFNSYSGSGTVSVAGGTGGTGGTGNGTGLDGDDGPDGDDGLLMVFNLSAGTVANTI